MDNSVPLWAFLGTAAFAAIAPVAATIVSVWRSNKNARVLLTLQHVEDHKSREDQAASARAMYLLDKKHEVYSEALDVFGRTPMDVAASGQNSQLAISRMLGVVTRVQMHAAPEVMAQLRVARKLMGELYTAVISERTPENVAEQRRLASMMIPALDALGTKLREDLQGERRL